MNKPDQNSKPAFSGERVRLGDVCAKGKSSLRQKDLRNDGPYVVFGASGIAGTSASYQNESPYVAVVKDGAGVGRPAFAKNNHPSWERCKPLSQTSESPASTSSILSDQ